MQHEVILDAARIAKRVTPDWPEPDLSILNSRRAPPPFPSVILGDFWDRWTKEQGQAVSAPIDYVAATLLAVAGALIGNARWVSPWSSWREPPVLWVALVGTPSSGKSPAMDPVLDLVHALELDMAAGFPEALRKFETAQEAARCSQNAWEGEVKKAVKDGLAPQVKPEAAVAPPKPARPRVCVADATSEALGRLMAANPKGLLYIRDELTGWLGNFDRYGGSGGDRAMWLEAWGGRSYIIDRVKLDGEPIQIPHLSVGVLGGIQPDRLASVLHAGDDDGLHARFLYFWPEPVPPRRPEGDLDNGPALAALRRLSTLEMIKGDGGKPTPKMVRLTDDAADLFQQWRRAHVDGEPSGRLAGWWGKCPGFLLRLALTLEFLWWAPEHSLPELKFVGKRAAAAAAAFVEDYLKPMAERAYGDAALPVTERNTATLAQWIVKKRPETVNTRDLSRKVRLPGLRDTALIRAAIENLEEAGWLMAAPSRAGINRGRQRADYMVNPKVLP